MKTSPFQSSADSFPSVPQSSKDVFIYFGEDLFEDIGLSTKNYHPKKQQSPSFLSSNKKVPKDVVKVLIHPWVKVIPNGTFSKCDRLQEVQFGFANRINDNDTNGGGGDGSTRSSANHGDDAPASSFIQNDYHCALEIIGESAFSHCVSLKHVALPPSLKWIQKSAFEGCLTLLSVELCHGLLTRIDDRAFCDCYGLKNIAIPDSVEFVGESVVAMRKYTTTTTFDDDNDDEEDTTDADDDRVMEDPLVRSLRKRFVDLPIHRLCYFFHQLYPDYDSMDEKDISLLVEDIATSHSDGNSKSATTDSFGMTPLHLIACSARPNSALLKVLLDRVYKDGSTNSSDDDDYYCYSVLTKDSWGNYPIHYAVRCNAPLEIVQLLIEYQLANHSGLDDTTTISKNQEQPPHLRHRRKEPPYWKGLLDLACNLASLPITKFLMEASMKDRIEALQCPAWKEDVQSIIFSYQEGDEQERQSDFEKKRQFHRVPKSLTIPQSRLQLIKAVEKRLEWYKFQEPLSLLELAVWKAKWSSASATSGSMDENQQQQQEYYRENFRIHCGTECVTMNVLDFLGSFEDQQQMAIAWKKKKKKSIPLLPTPNPWGTVPALRHL
mmetsp:Transcript_34974/g.84664  ORF Transcript_34974/g.84664 Transcript_34974/m.84664 type:complete len:607 (+) Transcript_34974:138-1958(+)